MRRRRKPRAPLLFGVDFTNALPIRRLPQPPLSFAAPERAGARYASRVVRQGLSILVATAALATNACFGGCPDPVLANPTTAALTATWDAPDDAGAPQSHTSIVVRWSASPDDKLPPTYYEPFVAPGSDAGAFVASVKRTGTRELTLEVRDLDEVLRTNPTFDVVLVFPDQRTATQCSHPGMADRFYVPLTIHVEPGTHAATASFGSVSARRGACSVARPGAGRGVRGFAAVALVAALLARRRRARVLSCA